MEVGRAGKILWFNGQNVMNGNKAVFYFFYQSIFKNAENLCNGSVTVGLVVLNPIPPTLCSMLNVLNTIKSQILSLILNLKLTHKN